MSSFMFFKTPELQKNKHLTIKWTKGKETKRGRCMNDAHLNIYLSGDSLDPRQIT